MVNLETLGVVFIIGGITAAITYAAYKAVDSIASDLKSGDLLPALPWEGPPVPRGLLRQPELVTRATEAAGIRQQVLVT